MKVKRRIRYPFRFRVDGIDGKNRTITSWATARYATHPVDLVLTEDHVKKSKRLGGIGNTQTCTMAICGLDHKSSFSHEVDGFLDWTYRRCIVATRTSKKTGLPTACVIYAHGSKIAHLNDTRGGQDKLLEMLQAEGPMTIRLLPIKGQRGVAAKAKPKHKVRDVVAGKRAGQSRNLGQGAKRRFAFAQLGGVPSA